MLVFENSMLVAVGQRDAASGYQYCASFLLLGTSHAEYNKMLPIFTDVLWSVCECPLDTTKSWAKTAEPVEIYYIYIHKVDAQGINIQWRAWPQAAVAQAWCVQLAYAVAAVRSERVYLSVHGSRQGPSHGCSYRGRETASLLRW